MAGRDERRRFWSAIAAGLDERGCCARGRCIAGGRDKMVPDKQGGCHPRCSDGRPSRFRGGISRLRSGRRSRFFALRATQCRRLLAGLGGQRRRSHVSCGAMLRLEAAVWSIVPRQRNGTPSDRPVGQNRRSLRSTRHCEPMWRSDWPASSSLRAGLLFPVRPCPGKAVDMDGGKIGGGQTPGARSRSPADCRSTSRTMRPCASATKPSIKRCSFKDEARCGAS